MAGAPPAPTFFFSLGNGIALSAAAVALAAVSASRRRLDSWPARGARVSAAIASGCLALAAMALYVAPRDRGGLVLSACIGCWEASVILIVCVGLLSTLPPSRPVRRLDLALVLFVSLLVRLFALDAVPPRVVGEEVFEGLYDLRVREPGAPEIFGVGSGNMPNVGWAVHSLLMGALGDGLWGFRMASVVLSLLAVAFTYLLASEALPGRLPGVAAALFLSFQHVFLFHSRTGHPFVQGPLAVVVILYLCYRSLSGGGWGAALLAGTAAGTLGQGYFSSRAGIVVALLLYGLAMCKAAARAEASRSLAAFVAGFLVALGPMAIFLVRHPESIGAREAHALGVTVSGPPLPEFGMWRKYLEPIAPRAGGPPAPRGRARLAVTQFAAEQGSEKPDDTLEVKGLVTFDGAAWRTLGKRALETVRVHAWGADADTRYVARASFLPRASWPLVLIGFAGLVRARPFVRPMIALWVVMTLVPGALLLRDVEVRRTLPMVPLLGLIVAHGFPLLSGDGRRKRLLRAAAMVLLGLYCARQADLVLRRYPRLAPADLMSSAADFAARHPGLEVQLFTPGFFSSGNYFLRLMAPRASVRDVLRADSLHPGPLLVSALHGETLAAIGSVSGVAIEHPWGRGGAWTSPAHPSYEDAMEAPAALVRLPSPWPPPWLGGTVTLYGEKGVMETTALPLLAYDWDGLARPEVRRVELRTCLSGSARARIRVQPRSMRAPATVRIDGREIAQGADAPLPAGRHEIAVTFALRGDQDSLQLAVEPRALAQGFRRCP